MRRSAFIALIAASGCAHHRSASVSPFRTALPGVRIAALGDSLAFGTGASSPQKAFIFRAFEMLRAGRPASEIDNFAMGGSTARDVLRLQAPRLRSTRFHVIVICVGGNDVVRRVPSGDFARTYGQLLTAAAGARRMLRRPGRWGQPLIHRLRSGGRHAAGAGR
jgi:lysophospholipase L1-like esterase